VLQVLACLQPLAGAMNETVKAAAAAVAAAEKLNEETARAVRVQELRHRFAPTGVHKSLLSWVRSNCVVHRLAALQDDARPAAVARRRATGQRTARENVKAVVDEGTFAEYVRCLPCCSSRGDTA
jgi:hypothetical protein